MNTPLMQPTPPPGQEAAVEKMLAPLEEMLGFIPDPLRLMGVSPALLSGYLEHIGYYMEHPRLSPNFLAMLRYLVSDGSGCAYCISLNEQMLLQGGLALEAIRSARRDPATAPLPEGERALLALALKVVRQPDAVAAADLDAVRVHGWKEGDLFDAAYHGTRTLAMDLLLKAFKVETQGSFN